MHIYTIKVRTGAVLIFLTIVLITGILLIDTSDFIHTFVSKEPVKPSVLIDAGHGGLDGGAVSSDGLMEAPINLAISIKLSDLLVFFRDQLHTNTDRRPITGF